ncbi:MAG: NUDIX hydrolase [Nocardioides sp.]
MPSNPEIAAAGCVVSRKGPEVLLVHRPKYDDWSFPKGKADPGEHVVATAVREVAEETGLDVRLGPPLTAQVYQVGNGQPRDKRVHYWAARVVGGDDVSGYRANEEIDEVAWVELGKARKRLTYAHDRETLDEFEGLRKKTHPLIVLRHGRARSRKAWRGDDRERTLTKAGELQAEQLVPLLAAYGVTRVVSSSSRRCWTSVAPYADVADLDVEVTAGLSEEDATADTVSALVHRLIEYREPTVLCTHRPVLPWVWEALGLEDRTLEPGGMLVAHHRRSKLVAAEEHDPVFR